VKTPSKKTPRLIEIDALRGIAACSVMFFHFTTRVTELYPQLGQASLSFASGHYGVNLFFIISGFVIFMTLNRTTKGMDFIVSRFSRLYPAYWLAVGLTYAVTSALGLPGKTISLYQALGNILMFHGIFGIPHVDGVYWTLEVELIFYIGMFTLFRTRALAKIHWFLLFFLALKLLYFIFQQLFSIDLPWIVYRFLILAYIPWFTIGISIYLLIYPKDEKDAVKSYWLILAAASVLAVCESWGVGLLAAAMALAVFAASTGRMPWLANPLLAWLGAISYTLYLVHENIGWALQLQLSTWGLQRDFGILVVIATSFILASILTYCVEKPAMQYIRRQYRARTK
jgi:peptidoglycan/LPS O-acetylase OafA/YrhL